MGIKYLDEVESPPEKKSRIKYIDEPAKEENNPTLGQGAALGIGIPAGALAAKAVFDKVAPVAKQIPNAFSAKYGVGNKADAFANKVNKAFVQTHTDKINEFGADLKKHVANNPTKAVDLSELVTDIQADPNIDRTAIRILKKSPKLDDLLENPKLAGNVSLEDSQQIINHLNGKVKSGGYDIQEAINTIKGSQLDSFPEMAETRANYRNFIEPYKVVKNNFRVGKILPAIESKFGDAQRNVRVTKIMPKDIMSEINAYRKATMIRDIPAKIPLLGNFFRPLSKIGGALGVAGMPLQAADMGNQFNQWRQQSANNPNSISTLDPMTGMPRIMNREELVV